MTTAAKSKTKEEARKPSAPKEKPLRTLKKALPVPLTDEEVGERSRLAGRIQNAIDRMEAKNKEKIAVLKSEVLKKKTRLRDLLKQLATGTEQREVECAEMPVYSKQLVEIVRLDTNVVVDTRTMTQADNQQEIFNDQKADPPKN